MLCISKNQSIFPCSEFNHDKAEKGQTYNYQMIMMKIFEVHGAKILQLGTF